MRHLQTRPVVSAASGSSPGPTAILKLEVWGFPDSAGVIIDAVRRAKLAKDRGRAGRRRFEGT
jgi:hypothetical protein